MTANDIWLWVSAKQGDLADVQKALNAGADVNSIDEVDRAAMAALHCASW